jgi:hypothetical protein
LGVSKNKEEFKRQKCFHYILIIIDNNSKINPYLSIRGVFAEVTRCSSPLLEGWTPKADGVFFPSLRGVDAEGGRGVLPLSQRGVCRRRTGCSKYFLSYTLKQYINYFLTYSSKKL